MTKRLVDIDDTLLEAAQSALGTVTLKETVNTSLTMTASAARRRQLTVEDLQDFGRSVQDLGDPDAMAKAWE